MRINVLMPMGGLGSRFVCAGYTTPKPLIPVDGKPMFVRAFESFPDEWEIEPVFVVRSEHEKKYSMSDRILQDMPMAKIAFLSHNTAGCVESCMAAADLLSDELPVVIADCDMRFHSREYENAIISNQFDGVLVGFDSKDPRYSYAEIDQNGIVKRTAEKKPISQHALLGGYYFGSTMRFKDLADHFLKTPLDGLNLKEYYVSHLFNMLLDEEGLVRFANADSFDSWGTPEEYEAYQARNR